MKNKSDNIRVTVGPSIGILDILGVVFVILKLIGKISWPWIWVTVPFWGQLVVVAILLIILGIVAIVATR